MKPTLEFRRAFVFTLLMGKHTDIALFPDYIMEKWDCVKDHPCPEQMMHQGLVIYMSAYLEKHGMLTPEYIREMTDWGLWYGQG